MTIKENIGFLEERIKLIKIEVLRENGGEFR